MPDPALLAGLAELLQLGLVVARVVSGLAAVEGQALAALEDAAVAASRAVVGAPASMAEAVAAGQLADASDAARDAIAKRVAVITEAFDKAARAVRRTAALQARVAEGRGWRRPARGESGLEQAGPLRSGPGPARRPAGDAERAERMDDPEWGDEIGGMTDEEVVQAICRDLEAASPVADAFAGEGPDLESPDLENGGHGSSAPLTAAISAIRARAAAPEAPSRTVLAVAGPPGAAENVPPRGAGSLPEPDS